MDGTGMETSGAAPGQPPAASADDRYSAVGQAAELAGHGIVIFQNVDGREGVVTFANEAAAAVAGYGREELVGRALADLVHPDSLAAALDRHRRRRMGETVQTSVEMKVVRRDGSVATVETSAVITEVAGRTATVVFLTDITARKATEAMLQESEEKYRHLVENIGGVLYSVDDQGITTYISPVFESLFGLNPDVLVGKRFADFIHPEDLAASMENFARTMSGSLDVPWECRMVLPGTESVFWVQGYNRPVHQDGVIAGFQGVLVDVTARKQVDELKDQFIGLVSHELRTPLTVIMGAVDTALSEGPRLPAKERRRLLEDAASEAGLLSHILDNLLELSRSRADRLSLQIESVSLPEAVRRTMERVQSLAPAAQLAADLPDRLPPVRADRIRLEQVVYNLLDNAVKYSPGSEVRLSARRRGQDLVICVHDRGPAIPPEDRARLFRPFERIRSDRTGGIKGIGLGLVVCRSLVEAHGGRIWLEPGTGEGNTFCFTIPIKGPAASGAPHSPNAAA